MLARIEIQGKYQEIKAKYEQRVGKIEKLEGSLIGAETQAEQYHEELELLRRKNARMEK